MRLRYLALTGFFMAFIALFAACEYDVPSAIWQENNSMAENPVITRVNPPDWAFAAVTEIVITGNNFPETLENLKVYIGSFEADVISTSPTEIRIVSYFDEEKKEKIIKDSQTIYVVKTDAYLDAAYSPYELKQASSEFGDFQPRLDRIFSIAVDNDDNIYTQLQGKTIAKVSADGTKNDTWGATSFPKASSMRVGADYLYMQKSNNKNIYRIPLTGGTADDNEIFVTLPEKTRYIEFGPDDVLYAGGTKSDLFIIQNDASFQASGHYADFDIFGLRVYDNKLFVSADYSGPNDLFPSRGIFFSLIKTDGTLGEPQIYFDWSEAGEHSAYNIYGITFNEAGDLLVGTNAFDPILIIHPDKTNEPLYPGILVRTAEHLLWGGREFLYVNRTETDANRQGEVQRNLIRVNMGQNGAPNYGRN